MKPTGDINKYTSTYTYKYTVLMQHYHKVILQAKMYGFLLILSLFSVSNSAGSNGKGGLVLRHVGAGKRGCRMP